MECSICCCAFSKAVRKPVECPFCKHVACRQCTERFLLERCIDAKCMNCNKVWTHEFLALNFTHAWLTREWRGVVVKRLLDQQKSMLPGTQETRLPGYRKCKRLEARLEEVSAEVKEAQAVVRRLEGEERRLQHNAKRLRDHGFVETTVASTGTKEPSRSQRAFFACPAGTCRGLVTPAGVCGTCGGRTCVSCRAVLAEGHVCDPAALATAKLLAADTRPCPSCHVPIHRTAGCDQMWCTNCNTAYSWNTGNVIERGQLHNPHYFEFLNRQTAPIRHADNDFECPGDETTMPGRGFTAAAFRNSQNLSRPVREVVSTVVAYVAHMSDVTLRNVRRTRDAAIADPYLQRIQFLEGENDEASWGRFLWMRHVRIQKSTEYAQLVETFVRVMVPIATATLRRMQEGAMNEDGAKELVLACERTVDFCNEGIVRLNALFKCKLRKLDCKHVTRMAREAFKDEA